MHVCICNVSAFQYRARIRTTRDTDIVFLYRAICMYVYVLYTKTERTPDHFLSNREKKTHLVHTYIHVPTYLPTYLFYIYIYIIEIPTPVPLNPNPLPHLGTPRRRTKNPPSSFPAS